MCCKRALRFQLSNLFRTINSVEHWHLPVHQDDIQLDGIAVGPSRILGGTQIVECFLSVDCDVDLMPFRAKLFAQDASVDYIVFDQQNVERFVDVPWKMIFQGL